MRKLVLPNLTLFLASFINNKRLVVFLCLSVLFNCSLILYRNFYLTDYWWGIAHYYELIDGSRGPSFLFLVWNLFLAWVPYAVSLLIWKEQPKWIRYSLWLVWLLFFPNAPYIITDLLHLQERLPVPLWYDMLTIFSFAWTGLIFAYLSLVQVQKQFFGDCRPLVVHLLTAGVWLLAGLGIYIGRFLRWNSWDVLAQPQALLLDLGSIFVNPNAHWPTIGAGILLAILLFLGFSTLREVR